LLLARLPLSPLIQCLIQRAGTAQQQVLFHFPVPYSIDECVGGLRLNVAFGKPNKGLVRQLFDGCGELLQCLTTRLHPGLKL
jgi:hypothetical protein